jgi:predicted Holliday junction resolvase-like endonuclease
MRLTIFINILVVILWSASVSAVDDKEVQKAVELAKQTFEQALKEQGGWVSTKKLIKSAELSATKGDREKALKLAEQAKLEAELSLQQALNQKQKWSEPAYLK